MKKKDFLINYEHSYRKRGRKPGNRILKIILFLLIAIAIGLFAYYSIKKQIDLDNKPQQNADNDDAYNDLVNNEDTSIMENHQNESDNNSQQGLDQDKPEADTDQGLNQDVNPINQNEDNSTDSIDDEVDNRVPVVVKGIYVTAGSMANRGDELMAIADTTEVNALVIDVKADNGRITYKMDSKLVNEIGAATNTVSNMEDTISTLNAKGIYAIARIVAFKDPYLAEHKKELAIRKKDGSLYKDNNNQYWINPYKKEVWDYLIEVATEAAKIGFDEIQFDYIRFSTGGGIENADYGEIAENKSKEDIINQFTQYAYEKLKPLGVFVSADVYGTIISSKIDAALIGQNYIEMAKNLDFICPMIYPSHFGEGNYGIQYPDLQPLDIIRKVLVASKEKLDIIPADEHRAIVRPWLQDFTASWISQYQVYGGQQVREQIEGVYAAGYEEWLLWNSTGRYSVDGLLEE